MKRAGLFLILAACGSPSNSTPPDPTPDAPVAPDAPDAGPIDPGSGGDPFAGLRAMPATCSADQWCWRTPTPAGNDYSRIFSTAPDNIWLVGQHGTVMQWDGRSWISHHPPVLAGLAAAQYPGSISGRSPTDMWLIYGSTVQHWDGATWTIRDSLPPNGIVSFNSVWAAPGGEVWVTTNVGSLKRSQNGLDFQLVNTGCNNCFLGSIWGTSSDDFFVTTLPAGILHYNGQSFVRSYAGPLIAGSYMGTKNDVWVSGADGAMLHWDGTAWTTFSADVGDGWYIAGLSARASNDVWWWANRSSATSAFLHWDGTKLTTTPVDTTPVGGYLYAGAIIDDRWWLVGAGGAVYTKSGPDTVSPVVDPQVMNPQSMWGTADDHMYFATGGQIRHWEGAAMTTIPIAASKLSGIRTGGVEELFATGVELNAEHTQYIANAFRFDGTSWSKFQLKKSTLQDPQLLSGVLALGPGEAIAVGDGGSAFYYAGGTWTQVATGTAVDLTGVWGPDAERVWITGENGTLLQWSRANPAVATPDPSFPATTEPLAAIHGADGVAWITTGGAQVWRGDASGWTQVPAGIGASGVFAVSATNVVVSSAGQSLISRWNGAQFVLEDNASGGPTPVLFQPPGGAMLAGGLRSLVQHP